MFRYILHFTFIVINNRGTPPPPPPPNFQKKMNIAKIGLSESEFNVGFKYVIIFIIALILFEIEAFETHLGVA